MESFLIPQTLIQDPNQKAFPQEWDLSTQEKEKHQEQLNRNLKSWGLDLNDQLIQNTQESGILNQ